MNPVENMSFEEALQELEQIVRRLEEGKTNLNEAIQAYERGASLRIHCEKKLKDARLRVEKIVVGADESITKEPVSFEE